MKGKILPIVLIVMLVAAFMVTPALAQGEIPPVDPTPLTVPDALTGLIALGIGFLVTQGLKALFQKSGGDLAGAGAAITAGLVSSVVAFANYLLSLIPAAYHDPVSIALTLIVSIFGVFGLHYTYSALKPK